MAIKVREGSGTEIIFSLTDGDGNGARLSGKRVEVILVNKGLDKEEAQIYSNLDNRPIVSVGAVNQTQVLTVAGTSGQFKLQYNQLTTGFIPYNASAEAVQNALEGLQGLAGNVRCSGGPLPTTPVTIEFINNLFGTDQPLLRAVENTAQASVTGTTKVVLKPERNTFCAALSPYNVYIRAIDALGDVKTYPESTEFFFVIQVEPSYVVER